MVKKIIIPIVAALVAVVVAVGATAVVRNKDNNIWYEAAAVRGRFVISNTEEVSGSKTFDLVYSYEEFIDLCDRYSPSFLKEENANCSCKMCTRLRIYDKAFFEEHALIVSQQFTADFGVIFSIKDIYVENNTLILNLYEVRRGGPQACSCLTNFIALKKLDINGVECINFMRIPVTEKKFPKYKDLIIVDGEEI